MKKKYSRILGVALTLVLLASFFGFAAPVSAANVGWSGIVNPGATLATGLNLADVEVGPIAVTPDGNTLFAAVNVEPAAGIAGVSVPTRPWALLQSADGGHNWTATGLRMNIGPITSIAISANFATDGTMYVAAWSGALGTPAVFSTKNSGATFTEIKAVTAEAFAATPTTVINSIAMWPASPYAYVMVGTDTDVWVLQDAPFGIWRDQEVSAVGPVNIAAVAFAPDFATTNYIWAVTAAGVVTTTNSPGAWGTILGNTGALAAVVSADIDFPEGYSSTTTPYLWVGLNSGAANLGGVWRIRGLPGVSQAIAQLTATDVRSIAVSGGMATATILAGLEHAATIRGSLNGGVTWMLPVFKQPTGSGVTYVVMAPDFATSNLAYVGTSDTVFTLGVVGTDTAASSGVTSQGGSNSVLLTKVGATTGSTHVQLTPGPGITLSAFQAAITAGTPKWSFWHNTPATLANWAQFELRFEEPGGNGWVEITAVGLQNYTGTATWVEETLSGTTPAGYGGWGEAGVTAPFSNWGPLTPLSGILAAVNGEAAVTTSASGWVLTRVRVELWEAAARSCYIDDITINGITYPLEPIDSAFQVSRNAGMSWNQTGLIDTPFTAIKDVAVVSLDTIFMVSDNLSLWKTTDATATAPVWERILTSATVVAPFNALTAAPGTIDFVETSPDFLTDGVVYAANTGTGIMKSTDGGDIFAPMGPPTTAITALHVVDATFAFTGAVSNVYRTDDGGYSWLAAVTGTAPVGTVVSIATSPDYATDGTVLVGTDSGTVYRSAMTRGATFAIAGAAISGVTNTFVAFDPGYATNSTVYAGGNAVIARYNFALPTVPWTLIDTTIPAGVGAVGSVPGDTFTIYELDTATAAGYLNLVSGSVTVTPTGTATVDGAAVGVAATKAAPATFALVTLALGDGFTVTATVAGASGTWGTSTGAAGSWLNAFITTDVDGDASVGLGAVASGTVYAGAFSLPDPFVPAAAAAGASTINGLVTSPDGTLYGSNALLGQGMERSLNPTALTTRPVEGWIAPVFERASALAGLATFNGLWLRVDETLDVVGSKNVLFSINTTANQIMTYTDTLAAPVVSLAPEDGAVFPREAEVTLEWEALTGARSYHWQIARDARFSLITEQDVSGYTTDTSALLGAGRTYYWRVRVASVASVIAPAGSPVLSRWSETRTFTTLLGARPWHPFSNIGGVAPGPGAQDVLTKPTFQWNGADWATSYQLVLADNAAFTGATTKTLTTTSWVSDTDLGYSTTWYWKVIALSATSESEWSDVGVFTTMAEPAPPVVVEEVQPPVIEVIIPEQPAAVEVTPVAPAYLLAMIIIGAVLVIFVIVLIVRTRRPV